MKCALGESRLLYLCKGKIKAHGRCPKVNKKANMTPNESPRDSAARRQLQMLTYDKQ
ncbi:MAG: hypothetical protein J6I61_03265 [Prevotella sp.]|nr:hypothetical protein [Prevotella sp.]